MKSAQKSVRKTMYGNKTHVSPSEIVYKSATHTCIKFNTGRNRNRKSSFIIKRRKYAVGHELAKQSSHISSSLSAMPIMKGSFLEGTLLWAKLGKYNWWPGMMVSHKVCVQKEARQGHAWVYWFGDHSISEVTTTQLVTFITSFKQHYNPHLSRVAYKRAVIEVLDICASRSNYTGSDLIMWACNGFLINEKYMLKSFQPKNICPVESQILQHLDRIAGNNDVQSIRSTMAERRCQKITRNGETLNPTDFCLCCGGSRNLVVQHPMFEGLLCNICKDGYLDSVLDMDKDSNMWCTICANGGEQFICENRQCRKVYCMQCIEKYEGLRELLRIKLCNKWICYLCDPESNTGQLKVKPEWKNNLLKLYQPEELQTRSLPFPSHRHNIRVLSLFDGLGTGKLVLNELQLDTEVYYASEIDADAITIAATRQAGITHIGDVKNITKQTLKSLGPIDLLIGGSPCNDLSLVNHQRRGFEGSGSILFFDYYRILNDLQILNGTVHLFWLFENVVSMKQEYKANISRFLGCHPVRWDAQDYTAQCRTRYFWGNIPGLYSNQLYRNKVDMELNDVLMPKRVATVKKCHTIRSTSTSLMQGANEDIYPVHVGGNGGEGDKLWIPEIERLFGFPTHYTDVGNISPSKRQKLLAKSWSVPVIEQILKPLTQFFCCAPAKKQPKQK